LQGFDASPESFEKIKQESSRSFGVAPVAFGERGLCSDNRNLREQLHQLLIGKVIDK